MPPMIMLFLFLFSSSFFPSWLIELMAVDSLALISYPPRLKSKFTSIGIPSFPSTKPVLGIQQETCEEIKLGIHSLHQEQSPAQIQILGNNLWVCVCVCLRFKVTYTYIQELFVSKLINHSSFLYHLTMHVSCSFNHYYLYNLDWHRKIFYWMSFLFCWIFPFCLKQKKFFLIAELTIKKRLLHGLSQSRSRQSSLVNVSESHRKRPGDCKAIHSHKGNYTLNHLRRHLLLLLLLQHNKRLL